MVDDALIGQVLEGRYVIEAELGRGAMAIVYRARHVRLGRPVAIKILSEQRTREPNVLERFEHEAMIAARLHHTNLASAVDVGNTASGKSFLVMELASGPRLSDLIAKGPIPAARATGLVIQMLHGLEHAHAAGLIHCDLKPDNIIIESDHLNREVPRIVDFGVSVLHPRGGDGDVSEDREHRRLAKAGVVLGTPAYMSPEHSRGQELDPRADLFALGVIMYEMLAGVLPFMANSHLELVMKTLTQQPPLIATRAKVVVDPSLEDFVRKLMARRKDHRYATATAAREALAALAAPAD